MSDTKTMPTEGVFLAGYRTEEGALIADTYGWQQDKLGKFIWYSGKVTWQELSLEDVEHLKNNSNLTYTPR